MGSVSRASLNIHRCPGLCKHASHLAAAADAAPLGSRSKVTSSASNLHPSPPSCRPPCAMASQRAPWRSHSLHRPRCWPAPLARQWQSAPPRSRHPLSYCQIRCLRPGQASPPWTCALLRSRWPGWPLSKPPLRWQLCGCRRILRQLRRQLLGFRQLLQWLRRQQQHPGSLQEVATWVTAAEAEARRSHLLSPLPCPWIGARFLSRAEQEAAAASSAAVSPGALMALSRRKYRQPTAAQCRL